VGAGRVCDVIGTVPAYPFFARSTAICRPIPRDAPITSATFCVVEDIFVCSFCLITLEYEFYV
jgi:hypothetical protein